MGPSERSHQHGPPLLGRVQVGYPFPGVIARMQPSDSLIPIGLGSGRPLPSAYPGARATRSNEGLPGVRAVLFQRAVVVDPAGCGALLAHGAGPAVAFRLHEALGTQEDVVSRLQGLRPTRSRTYASATALPRSPQGSLPAWVGWPLTGRGSHPLDDTQGFMTYSSIPLDRPAWPHHATTPLVDVISSFRMAFDYFALDLQNRESADSDDRRRLEDMERAMGASFPTGFPDLTVFEEQAPFRVAEAGSFSGLAVPWCTTPLRAESLP